VTANALSSARSCADSETIGHGEFVASPGRESSATHARERLAAIVESSDDAIIGKTLDGIITNWNQAAHRIFGYSADEAIGKSVSMLIPRDRLTEEADIIQRIARGERVSYYQTKRLTKDRRLIDVMLTVSPIKDRSGRIIGASKIARDVTDLNMTQEALANQAEALKRSNEELERYAYIASHDLQEPLRTVASFARLLKQRCAGSLPEEGQEYLKFITDGVDRMQSLIQDLLSYSRIESRGTAFGTVDCAAVVARVLENLKSAMQSQGAEVTVDPLPTVIGDATQLGQVFQNLLANAIKFQNGKCSQIRVSAEEKQGEWQFSVRDNGIGIAPEYFERIFIIFQRLHTMEEYSGTGIGLAVCKKIVERHGGRIWLESSLGEGSNFFFSIPKREGDQ
jgi:hypothetical protein